MSAVRTLMVFAMVVAQDKPLLVTNALPDAGGQSVTITGVNFGQTPFVTLDLVPLTLQTVTDSKIVAAVPVSIMPPGEYLLTVSRGASPADTGSFQLIIGAGKPKPLAAETGRPGSRAAPAPSGPGSERAAQVGDRVITVAEVDREWQRADPAGYIALSRQIYEIRRRIADTMAADELLAREAAARGLTVAALLAEEIPRRIITTPDAAVRSLYEGLGERARGASFEQMRPALRAWLQRITEPELAKMTYVEELMKVSTKTERFLEAPRVDVERSPQDAALGPATAPIELVAFGDFQNTEYARFARVFGRVRETFGDRLRLVVKNLPTLGSSSVAAAEAAQCALAQGRFWPYHDGLLVPPGIVGAAQFKRLAADLGLDSGPFDTCVDRGTMRGVVQQALDEARRYGVQTSPSFLINGRLAPAAPPFLPPFDYFKRLIEEELGLQAKAASRPRP
ncbi:MAG TPA: thioredoxin domain-containing protein [Vicinamibacterales bacterium]|nr:thioredoxin domain-containing protein [Vicinamibacterales bacterium]